MIHEVGSGRERHSDEEHGPAPVFFQALREGSWAAARRACPEGARVEDFNVEERMVEMADGVYRVTEVIGVSGESWEAAARSAVETAAKTVRDLRIAEVVRQDVSIENGKIKNYRVRLAISFKYEAND